jgi:hypothetical protein
MNRHGTHIHCEHCWQYKHVSRKMFRLILIHFQNNAFYKFWQSGSEFRPFPEAAEKKFPPSIFPPMNFVKRSPFRFGKPVVFKTRVQSKRGKCSPGYNQSVKILPTFSIFKFCKLQPLKK